MNEKSLELPEVTRSPKRCADCFNCNKDLSEK